MRALVIYESVYGNTHEVADAISNGLAKSVEVAAVAVGDATPARVADAELVVVGGPTHAHGMSSDQSRRQTVREEETKTKQANPKKPGHELDDAATGEGLRSWFKDLARVDDRFAAAFDTRFDKPRVLTGSAAKGIDRRLRKHGYEAIAEPTSFFVDHSEGPLAEGEADRAREWGEMLGARLVAGSERTT